MNDDRPQTLRRRLWPILNDPGDPRYVRFHYFINILIVISVVIIVWQELGEPPAALADPLHIIDNVILGIFLVEFLGRLWVIRGWMPKQVHLRPMQKVQYWIVSRVRFILTPWGLIDFVALLPLFPFLRSLRILRLLRLFRTIQFFRYTSPLRTLTLAFRDNALLFAVSTGFMAGAIILAALMFFLAEKKLNPAVDGIADTLWWSIVTVSTVGFGDITPVTPGGKVVGAALMLSGMFMIAMLAGVISSTLVGHLLPLRMEQVRMSSIADHVVIAGWNSEVPMMLSEMELEYADEMPQVIVFSPRERPEGLEEHHLWVQGDFRRESEYDKVRFKYARSVVVVADEPKGGESHGMRDASTVLTVFTIRSLERKFVDQRVRPMHIIAEILDPENHDHALVAGADEVIETTRLGSSLLAHTAGNPGVGNVISNLVLASRNNVYAANLPTDFLQGQSLSFAELQDKGREEYGVLVIGVVHNGQMLLNPAGKHDIYMGDKMVYIGPRTLE